MKTLLLLALLLFLAIGARAEAQVNVDPTVSLIIFEGDSWTAFDPSFSMYLTNKVTGLGFGPWAVCTNTAAGGNSLENITSQYDTEIHPWASWPGFKIESVLIGPNNDFTNSLSEGTNYWTGMTNYMVMATNDGIHFMLHMMPIRGGDRGWSNAIYRANYTNILNWATNDTIHTWLIREDLIFTPSTLCDGVTWQEGCGSELHGEATPHKEVTTNMVFQMTTNAVPGTMNVTNVTVGNLFISQSQAPVRRQSAAGKIIISQAPVPTLVHDPDDRYLWHIVYPTNSDPTAYDWTPLVSTNDCGAFNPPSFWTRTDDNTLIIPPQQGAAMFAGLMGVITNQ